MQEKCIPLHRLPIGCTGRVKELRAKDDTRRRMLDLGLISDTVVKALCQSPSGNPLPIKSEGSYCLAFGRSSKYYGRNILSIKEMRGSFHGRR